MDMRFSLVQEAGKRRERERERERERRQSGFSWQMESRLSLRNYGHSHYTGLWYYVWPGNLVERFGGSMRLAERERDAYGELGWKSALGYWSRMEKMVSSSTSHVRSTTIRMRFYFKFCLKCALQVKTTLRNTHVSVLKCYRLIWWFFWSASEIFNIVENV